MLTIMSRPYMYSGNEYVESVPLDPPTILVEENVEWERENDEDDCGEETVDFADANDTLTENIDETYATADPDNTTQYFSLDASGEMILNNIEDNSKINGILDCDPEENDETSQQVVLFKIDDSDDLYGIQVGQDEDGNLQKYQFKVRQNEEGNLEAVPESIQILPLDNEEGDEADTEKAGEEENDALLPVQEPVQNQDSIFVKQEHVGEHLTEDSSQEQHMGDQEENLYQSEHVDSKEGILEVAASTVVHKQEIFDTGEDVTEPEDYGEENSEHYFEQDAKDIDEHLDQSSNYYVNGGVSVDEEEDDEEEGDDSPIINSSEHYEHLFVDGNHLIEKHIQHEEELVEQIHVEPTFMTEDDESRESESIQENINESDNDYEIIEGSHITGEEAEELHVNNEETVFDEDNFIKQSPRARRLIKNIVRKIKIKKINEGNKIANTYYLIKHPEKENVGAATANVVLRPNPRSILKCSVASVEPKQEIDEEKYEKRFAKSKEAQQARLFHNFIAQTKIIHAPVRQQRLPRKQQIKPMERTDEEIVVQEVVVCSDGFVETTEEGVVIERKSIKPTEYIQLTDSDEDYDPKAKQKRKRKHRKRKQQIEMNVSDSDEDWSDVSIIEIDESDLSEEENKMTKRPRGRPPKNAAPSEIIDVKNADEHRGNNHVKRPRGRPPKTAKKIVDEVPVRTEEKSIVGKTDNKCPKCPKSFPSEGSLRTHMQYHNFKESNKNLGKNKVSENKYKCRICDESFKNNFLLTRHANSHDDKRAIACSFCKKIFNDVHQLSMHKRTHIKQQMFKTTTVPKVSPRKVQSKRMPVKKPDFKCNDCDKIFSNSSALTAHAKTHRKYSCSTCGSKYLSSLMLQSHVRQSCVKRKKRLSYGTRRSLANPPGRTSNRVHLQHTTTVPNADRTTDPVKVVAVGRGNAVVTNIKCDSCPLTFTNYTSLYKHKVIKHGLESSESHVVVKATPVTKPYKPIALHSGVPPSEKLKRAFKELRSKLEK